MRISGLRNAVGEPAQPSTGSERREFGYSSQARRLLASVRNYDYVGRYGGEEFLILLTACTPSDLEVTAERMWAYVAEKPIQTDAGPIGVTISLGLAAQPAASPSLSRGEDLVRAADSALYSAKANGRNRVERSPQASPASPAGVAALQ